MRRFGLAGAPGGARGGGGVALPVAAAGWVTSSLDTFDGSSLANYTAVSGTYSETGGALQATNTADPKRLRRNGAGASLDQRVTVKVNQNNSGWSGIGGAALWIPSGSDFIAAYHDIFSGNLYLGKHEAGFTSFVEDTTTLPNNSGNGVSRWVRLTRDGDALTAEVFNADPNGGASSILTLTHTLAGADATKYGVGVALTPGFYAPTPVNVADLTWDDLRYETR